MADWSRWRARTAAVCMVMVVTAAACGGGDDPSGESGGTDAGASETPASDTSDGDSSAASDDSGDAAAGGDVGSTDGLVVGSFTTDGVTVEFGWVTCTSDDIGGEVPTTIVNATGTDEYPTSSLSIQSSAGLAGITQFGRVVTDVGSFTFDSGVSLNDWPTDDPIGAGLAFDPSEPLDGVLVVDSGWQILDGLDVIQVDGRLEIDCGMSDVQSGLGLGSSDDASAGDDDSDGNSVGSLENSENATIRVQLAGETYSTSDTLCIDVPFSDIVVVNGWGTAPDGSDLFVFVSNDPDDLEVQVEASDFVVYLTPDRGDDISLQRTDTGVRGTATVSSGSAFVGETLEVEATCE